MLVESERKEDIDDFVLMQILYQICVI